MATGERIPLPSDETRARPAAVLVLLAPDAAGEAQVILIERASYDGHHSAEISFPGGAAEPGDADATATAVREAAEEIGLDAAAIGLRILGALEPVWIPVSDYRVTPVLAVADRIPAWRPDPREVAGVFDVPIARFVPGAPIVAREREIGGWRIRYGAYPIPARGHAGEDLVVWGATARILGQLGAIVGEA